MEPIIVQQHPIKPGKWFAEAFINGKSYTATSRKSPGCDIARQLVQAGVPDAELRIYTKGLKGYLYWRSFYQAALYTYSEDGKRKIWSPFPQAVAQGAFSAVKAGHA
jgi:hypothetical protein